MCCWSQWPSIQTESAINRIYPLQVIAIYNLGRFLESELATSIILWWQIILLGGPSLPNQDPSGCDLGQEAFRFSLPQQLQSNQGCILRQRSLQRSASYWLWRSWGQHPTIPNQIAWWIDAIEYFFKPVYIPQLPSSHSNRRTISDACIWPTTWVYIPPVKKIL